MIKQHIVKTGALALSLLALLVCNHCALAEVSEKDIKSRLMKKHPIEASWKRLDVLSVFPTEEDVEKSRYFHHPVDLGISADSHIFVCDNYLHQIIKFNKTGEYKGTIGRKGEAPGEFLFPNKIGVSSEGGLFILEGGKQRVQIINQEGKYIREFMVFDHINDFLVRDGAIYANCLYPDEKEENPLVIRLDAYGKIIGAFGKRINQARHLSIDSTVFLAQSTNEIITVFEHYPLVRRYSPDGNLIKEFRININILNRLEKYNYKKQFTNPSAQVIRLPRLIAGVKVIGNRIYILAHLPRLEIIEVDMDGNIRDYYYSEALKDVLNLSGFEVSRRTEKEAGGGILFYVIQSSEEAKLYIFGSNGQRENPRASVP
jgi:hypothetical protein